MTNANPYESPQSASTATRTSSLPANSLAGNIVSVVGLLLAGIYLANPGWGVLELLPDNLPGIGNIDEVVATTIFLACLSRLGINILPNNLSRKSTVDSHVVKD